MARRSRKTSYKKKQPAGRIPTAPATEWHRDKSKYNRKKKHKESHND